MFKEEILYKKSRTGTTAFYFVPNVTPEQVPALQEPAYVILNNLNVPIEFHTYPNSYSELWTPQAVNTYETNVLLSSVTTNFLTGYSKTEVFNKILSQSDRTIIQQRFNNNVTNVITGQTQVPINYPTYVFFEEHEIDDLFANIKLTRSYETLDTLQVYNKPINSIPNQEAKTGILFGKLEAIQVLKDEVGNNIRIPLKNVPIGIFNSTENFPAPMSLDNNGDRFFMNIKESSEPSQYFDFTAYTEDQKFLKSQSEFLVVPDKFKYTTITNDNGEFVIYNAPVGNQVVVFEVDLFKQGLTKDEIILNNFPFPTNDDSNIGEFPCYFYNQVPVDVVPAWGTSQTGYTELNISVNLDLRKWTTYIFAPASFGNEKLETTVSKNVANTFKVQVRDMTNDNFASKILEITQIPNDLDRRSGASYLWFNEILEQRQQLEFFKFGCHVLKLPANLYDPNGFRTDTNGAPTSQRGVWLSAYQLNAFVNKERCTRSTGGYSDGTNFWSHFDVNYFPGATASDTYFGSGIGRFPYEKPWSISYPEPYKIPTKPIKKRYDYGSQRTYQAPFIIEEPAYEDGDLVGNVVYSPDSIAGAFGVQSSNGTWFANQISFVATKDYMYKYEKGVRWDEKYANGFEQYWSQSQLGPYTSYPILAGISSVNNGEKYQRLECGYGYFMKYHDWPRIYREDWASDVYFNPSNSQIPYDNSPGTYGPFRTINYWSNTVYNIDDQNFAFAFDQFKNFKSNKESIDVYRIVNSGLENINIPANFVIPTFARLSCDQTSRCESDNGTPAWRLIHQGQFSVKIKLSFNSGTVYYNDGNGGSGIYSNGQVIDMFPNGQFYSFDNNTISYVGLDLPGNSSYDSLTNKNTLAIYRLEAYLRNRAGSNRWYFGTTFNLTTSVSAWGTWHVNSVGTGSSNGIVHNGLSDDFDFGGSTYHWDQGSGQNEQDAYSIGVDTAYYNVYQGGYL